MSAMMRSPDEKNAAIELHDSVAIGVSREPHALILHLDAYVHRSHGAPAIDAGTGWSQQARITVPNGRVLGTTPDLPCKISDGDFKVGGRFYDDIIPCPFTSNEATEANFLLTSGDRLQLTGVGLSIVFVGAPQFIEDVP